jgi:hypothetical protein
MFEENLPSSTGFVASSHEHRTVRPAATPRQPNQPVFKQTRTGGRGPAGGRGGFQRVGGSSQAGLCGGGQGGGGKGAGPGTERVRGLGYWAGGRDRRAGKGADEGSGWYCARRHTPSVRDGGQAGERVQGGGDNSRPSLPCGTPSAAAVVACGRVCPPLLGQVIYLKWKTPTGVASRTPSPARPHPRSHDPSRTSKALVSGHR